MAKPTQEQLALFQALHDSRKKLFEAINEDDDFKSIWTMAIDKYPESAHFVYELLQNADDALATKVWIQILPEEMLFKHNGTKHFVLY